MGRRVSLTGRRAQLMARLLSSTMLGGAAAVLSPAQVLAVCSGSPTVTCSGATTSFGNGTQDNLTINVQSGSTITNGAGDAVNVRDGNIINLQAASSSVISTNNTAITMQNGANQINNNNGGTISGGSAQAIFWQPSGTGASLSINNTGTISGTSLNTSSAIGGGGGANVLTITNSGTISGSGANTYGIFTPNTNVVLTSNTGTITGGQQGILANALSGTNGVGGIIGGATTLIGAVSQSTGGLNFTNLGTIQGTNMGIGAAGGAQNSTLINAGTISSSAGNAVIFDGSNNTLELQAGSSITGNVLAGNGGTNNVLRLGGSANASFNAGSIDTGAFTQQYQWFDTFQKNGTSNWTLTGTGAQNWAVSGGTLTGTAGIGTGSIQGNIALSNGSTLEFNQAGAGTYLGSITGTGGLSKDGAGSVRLAVAQLYNGPTTIKGGTLQAGLAVTNTLPVTTALTVGTGASAAVLDMGGLGQQVASLSGNALGSILVTNGLLTVGDATSTTYGGTFTSTGLGGLTKIGSGTLTLTGNSFATHLGPTNVNGGTLAVNGSIGGSIVTLGAAGTLMGTGTVGGINAQNGTVAPGNSIGTMNVSGNVAFGPGSVFQVEANPAGQSDKIAATGTATLTGGTVQVLAVNGSYNPSTVYPILTAAGGVTGTFTSVTSNLAFLTASLQYQPNEVDLVLALNNAPPDPGPGPGPGPTTPGGLFSAVAKTFNQRAVAGALDVTLISNPVVAAVLVQTVPGALAAFDQLSGEAHASTASVLVHESLYARSAVLGRLRQASYGGESSMASLSAGGPQAFANGEELTALAYGNLPVKAPPRAMQAGPDVVFWAQGFGAWGRFDSDGNAASLKRDLAGFFSGVDTRVGTDGRLGIAAGYTGSRNNLDGRGSANVETGHVSGYGGWRFGSLSLRAGGDYAWHTIDTNRTIVFPGFFDTATAHYNGGTGQIFGEAGYGFAFGKVAVEPFAGGAWVRLHTDAFNERGGPAALAVAANNFEVGYSSLGIRAASMIPLGGDMVLVPRASVAWQHAFNNVTPLATLAFQNAGVPFVVAGVPIARDSLLGEAGLDLAIGRNATVGVSYVGQVARNVHDHAAKGKFSWKF